MYKGIFDSHTHYDDEKFAGKLDETLRAQREHGVSHIINNGYDMPSSYASVEMAEKYPIVWAAVGVHPNGAADVPADYLAQLERLCGHEKTVAIGEIGLDYYYKEPSKEIQKRVFCEQLELANRLGMPVEIHDREAHGDTMEILREYRPKGVLHRYSGSPETARELVKMGIHIGVGCAVTYKNAKSEAATVKELPLEFLILETDCPFLAPAQLRGQVSTSDMIAFAAERIAELRGDVTAQQVIDIARENSLRLFGIKE